MSLQECSFLELSQNTSEMYLSAGELLDTSAVIRDIANEATAFYNE
jgi:hypothetical protein